MKWYPPSYLFDFLSLLPSFPIAHPINKSKTKLQEMRKKCKPKLKVYNKKRDYAQTQQKQNM